MTGDAQTPTAAYYMLDLQKVPAKTWTVESELRDWIECCRTAGPEGFAPRSLGRLGPCPLWIQVERSLFYPLYFLAMNVLPFSFPAMPILRLLGAFPSFRQMGLLAFLQVFLMRLQFGYLAKLLGRIHGGKPRGTGRKTIPEAPGVSKRNWPCIKQHLDEMFGLERQNQVYFSTKFVLPRSIVKEGEDLPPTLVLIAPHGVLPLSLSGALSRVLGGRATRFGAAPVLFKIWGISKLLRRLGMYPACKEGMLKCLAGGDNSGLILDGIPGMFHATRPNGDEELYLLKRKAACSIALQAGCTIVPAYSFGTNEIWRVVDPFFGLLRYLSTRLDISFTPFFGRGWVPFGPPARRPLVLCFGDPIRCDRPAGGDRPSQQEVDAKHAEVLEGFRRVFDTHKAAYGRPNAQLHFV